VNRLARVLPLICAIALVSSANADELSDLRRARALADELMSPFCPGRTLSDCPSPNAAGVREEIRAWIGQGRSDEEIRDTLRARFGSELVGDPGGPWGRAAPLGVIAGVAILFALGIRRVIARPDSP